MRNDPHGRMGTHSDQPLPRIKKEEPQVFRYGKLVLTVQQTSAIGYEILIEGEGEDDVLDVTVGTAITGDEKTFQV